MSSLCVSSNDPLNKVLRSDNKKSSRENVHLNFGGSKGDVQRMKSSTNQIDETDLLNGSDGISLMKKGNVNLNNRNFKLSTNELMRTSHGDGEDDDDDDTIDYINSGYADGSTNGDDSHRRQLQRMAGASYHICALLCCPPIPSRIVAKLSFVPPKPPSYQLKMRKKLSSLSKWEESEALKMDCMYNVLMEDISSEYFVKYIKSERRNCIATIYMKCCAEPKYVIIFSHGNAVDMGHMLSFYYNLCSILQCDAVAYDYSGYGASTGRSREKNLYSDIKAVWTMVRRRVAANNIILYGQSIGTVPTIDLASKIHCAGVILHSPLASGIRVAFPHMNKVCCLNPFPSIGKVHKITARTLFIHGTDDDVIDFTHGVELHHRCNLAVDPLWIQGATHNNIETYPSYMNRLKQFIDIELPSTNTPFIRNFDPLTGNLIETPVEGNYKQLVERQAEIVKTHCLPCMMCSNRLNHNSTTITTTTKSTRNNKDDSTINELVKGNNSNSQSNLPRNLLNENDQLKNSLKSLNIPFQTTTIDESISKDNKSNILLNTLTQKENSMTTSEKSYRNWKSSDNLTINSPTSSKLQTSLRQLTNKLWQSLPLIVQRRTTNNVN
ncbi:hypothetical protein SNEBB_009780 [Seison nebaliae]|nr:hypothetical protein SNEBB_009780 [Seison nebaliae]